MCVLLGDIYLGNIKWLFLIELKISIHVGFWNLTKT